MPSTGGYLVSPLRIASIAACLTLSGVSKSGSPTESEITSRPLALRSRAFCVTAMVAEGLTRERTSAMKAMRGVPGSRFRKKAAHHSFPGARPQPGRRRGSVYVDDAVDNNAGGHAREREDPGRPNPVWLATFATLATASGLPPPHGWIPAFACMTRAGAAAARGRCGETWRLGLWRSEGPRAVILAEIAAAGACSASRPRLGEFDADRSLASPDHVDFAETARSVDLQCEGVGHLDIYFHRPHLGAAVGNVEDLAVDHGQYAAGIGPGANVLDLPIFIAAIVVAGKIVDFVVQTRLLNLGSFLERGSA